MLLPDTLITAPIKVYPKPLVVLVHEICEEVEPKPLFCEIPEDLQVKSVSSTGTAQTYTITSSMATTSISLGTTTTTLLK